uniref:Uncharacterized protein n=1 Tax=Caenorhabditis japonica TaxID=281687 RepID=A0A8R1E0D1_CAEJA
MHKTHADTCKAFFQNSAPAANEIEKKNKKDKKKSESEPAPAEVTPVVSQKPTADSMDFLDFVTAKPDQPDDVVEQVATSEAAPLEAAPAASDHKKKNKKDKKKSESEPAPVEATPVVSQKPTADSMDFLDFVTAKPDKPEDVVEQVATSEAAPLEAAPAASDHKKKNKKDKKKSESEPAPVEATPVVSQKPTADSMDFLDFVTAKPDQPDDVVEQVATAEASQIETSPVAIEGKKKNKKDKNKSESEKVSEPAPVPEAAASVSQKPTADSMDFLDFVTAKPDAVEEQSQNEPATVQEEASVPEQAEKKKNEKKSKKASESEPRPTADDSMDFLDFVSKKPEQEETVQEVKQVEQPKEKTAKKNKKNKKNSESEKNVSTVVEAAHSLPKPDSQTEVADQVDPLVIKVDAPVAEVPAATPIASTKQDADDLDFLNFVTPKAEKETAADTQSAISDTVEKSVPANDAPVDVSPVETALVENGQTATLNKKKNKKDKKKSESDKNSEPSQVVEEPIAAPINQSPLSSKKPTADDMDFLDFVSPKADADSSSAPDVTAAPETQLSAPKSSDSFEDLEIVDYDQIAEATSAQAQSPTKSASSPAQRSTPSPTSVLLNRSSKNKKKHHKKHKKHSESDKSQDPSKEDLEFLEFLNSEPKEVRPASDVQLSITTLT